MSDTKKPRLSLIPQAGAGRKARILEAGLRDGRQPGDWKKLPVEDLRDAMLRHVASYVEGETDQDHLAAIAVNADLLLWQEEASKTPRPAVDTSYWWTDGEARYSAPDTPVSIALSLRVISDIARIQATPVATATPRKGVLVGRQSDQQIRIASIRLDEMWPQTLGGDEEEVLGVWELYSGGGPLPAQDWLEDRAVYGDHLRVAIYSSATRLWLVEADRITELHRETNR